MRLFYATLAAIAVGALPLAVGFHLFLLVIGLMCSAILVLCFGMPLYVTLARKFQVTTLWGVIAGFLLAMAGMFLIPLIFGLGIGDSDMFTAENLAWFVLVLGVPGAIAGGLFTYIMTREKPVTWRSWPFWLPVGTYVLMAAATLAFGPNLSVEQPPDEQRAANSTWPSARVSAVVAN